MKKYKVLLLGASGIYGTTWYKEITRLEVTELIGVCASSMESFSKLPPVTRTPHDFYDNIEKAIYECDADIAVIVLPTHMHARACDLALKKGMHIICEKPVTANLQEAAQLCEEAKKHPDQKFMVAQNYRFHNHIRTLKWAAQNNIAGQISNILYEFRRPENLWGYRTNMELPLLKDVSIHHFDLMRYITGKNCTEIYSVAYKQPWCEFRDRASVEAIIKMEDGVIVNYTGTWSSRGAETLWDGKITMFGDKGLLTLDEKGQVIYIPVEGQPKVLENISDKTNRDTYKLTGELSKELCKGKDSQVNNCKEETHRCFSEQQKVLLHLIQCIEENRVPETSIWDNYNSFEMQWAAEVSIKENRPVRLTGL